MICVAQKTVRSHSPDEKYNLLAGGGRSGQCGQWQCSYWGLVTASLDTLNLIIVVGGFHPAGHCARMPITDTHLLAIMIDDIKNGDLFNHKTVLLAFLL